jgi:hypothetical protein
MIENVHRSWQHLNEPNTDDLEHHDDIERQTYSSGMLTGKYRFTGCRPMLLRTYVTSFGIVAFISG